ncbi:MAG: prolipoprotein diacylglyceryl transferase, partial [Pseudomonadales bacterium]
VTVRWYGLFLSLALVAAFFQLRYLVFSAGKAEYFDRIILFAFFGGVIGARVGHFLFYETAVLLEQPSVLVDLNMPGLASHGAIVGLMVSLWLSSLGQTFAVIWIYARTAIAYVLFCVIIRLGNFFNSEILGTPTDRPWAVTFARVDDLPRHPVQLYESAACAVCLVFLLWLLARSGDDRKTFGAALVSMSLIRLVTESFKAPQAAIEAGLPLTVGQYLTFPFLLAGLILLSIAFRYRSASI